MKTLDIAIVDAICIEDKLAKFLENNQNSNAAATALLEKLSYEVEEYVSENDEISGDLELELDNSELNTFKDLMTELTNNSKKSIETLAKNYNRFKKNKETIDKSDYNTGVSLITSKLNETKHDIIIYSNISEKIEDVITYNSNYSLALKNETI